ncbi:hypothetical protein Bbelb_083400 [Branchiostoma belcheri]|nr:hypothetical protein Bbelb_083400 [Branchiostoma belcheri]
MSRPVLLALVLLTVAVTTMLVAGNNICRLATYTKELRLHGRVQYVQAGECIVRTNYHIQWGKVEGARPRGRPRRSWITDLKEWTGLTANQMARLAEDRQQWKNLAKHHAAPTAD